MKRPYEMRVRTFDEEDCEFYITIKTPAVQNNKPSILHALRTLLVIVMISKDIINNMVINAHVREKSVSGLSIYVTFEQE
jgi:hypothetical protein